MGHWGWLIAIYLFLGGLGAGAFLASFLAEKGLLGKSESLARWGYIVSAPLAGIGTLLLIFDLGQGLHKPLLLIGLLKNYSSSVMTWGVYMLSVFLIIGLIRGVLAFLRKPAPAVLNWVGAIFAVGVMAYTGILLAVLQNIPLWNTPLLPCLFTVSAISTGISFVAVLSHFLEKGHADEKRLSVVHGVLVVIELVVFAALAIVAKQNDVAGASMDMMLTGKYATGFWGAFIGAGLVLPLIAYIWGMFKFKTPVHAGAQESAASGQKGAGVIVLSDVLVLVGGFALRALFIFSALPIWDGILK